MEPTRTEDTGSSALRRWGPLGALAVVAVVIAVLVVGGGGDEATPPTATPADVVTTQATTTEPTPDPDTPDEATTTEPAVDPTTTAAPTTTAPATPTGPQDLDPDTGLPVGVLTHAAAVDAGIADTIDWGERCDTETGRVRIPWFFRTACWAPFTGDNGGATDRGVTGDTIKIVYWIPQTTDPVVAYVTDAIVNDDTAADVEDTMRRLLNYYEAYYETYGRSVDLEVMTASGLIFDPVSSRADAVRIAEEIDPFMVWGGPALTNAFGEELMARGIPCIGCGPSQPADYYTTHHPLVWELSKSATQMNLLVAEYVGKRLAGRTAEHAGDPAWVDEERVFGRVWLDTGEASAGHNDQFEAALAEYGVEVAASVSYALDPATIQETATNVIAKLKAAGVTSVIFTGDPVAPRDFTREATSQGYFPEWILTGSALVDTNAFARTYDQEQWAHAFGLSNTSARVDPRHSGSTYLYEWWNGEEPAADDSIGIIDPFPAVFYSVLAGVGPQLTIENFAQALEQADPTTRGITVPTLSWGVKERWPAELEPDHFGADDVTEVWWNADLVGLDELRREAAGMYMFVDGGTRYLLGEMPDTTPDVFDPDGAVAMYDSAPEAEQAPSYEPLPSAPVHALG